MALHTKAFIRNSSEDRKDVIDRMMFITNRLQSIERQQGTVSKELQSYLENKTDHAVRELSRYLKSPEVIQQFSSWTLDDVPNTEQSWELTKNYIQKALMRRLQEKIKEWEEKNHIFSDARASLIQYFRERFSYVEGQLRVLEGSVCCMVLNVSISAYLIICFLLNLILGATSSEFHSISSTSESPPTQEELKKWKQKTKIVETEKLKGKNKIKRCIKLLWKVVVNSNNHLLFDIALKNYLNAVMWH